MSYNLSQLLRIPGEQVYLETLAPTRPPADQHVIERLTFRHPIFTPESVETRQQLSTPNDQQRTFYCGAYFGYGFHEDGLTSAMQVGEHFDISWA